MRVYAQKGNAMKQYVPIEKRSKKEQKAYYASKRNTWGELSPVTRRSENPKAYNRQKSRKIGMDTGSFGASCFI